MNGHRHDLISLRPGTRVHFVGGTQGRDDDAQVHFGIVNGRAIRDDSLNPVNVWIPVHMPDYNHNLLVNAANISEVLS